MYECMYASLPPCLYVCICQNKRETRRKADKEKRRRVEATGGPKSGGEERERQACRQTGRQRQAKTGRRKDREKGISTELYNIVENENCHLGAHRQKRRKRREGGGANARHKNGGKTQGERCVYVCVRACGCVCVRERDGVRDPVKHRDRRDPEA